MSAAQSYRKALLLVAVAIFALRVLGQVEVALGTLPELGPMCRWYSGLIPYPLLLPLQIGLLMFMTLVTYQHIVGRGRWVVRRRVLRMSLIGMSVLYAAIMALRLLFSLALSDGHCGYHIIPIATHWVLAGYIALLAFAPSGSR